VLGFLLCWEGIKLHLHWCHKKSGILFLSPDSDSASDSDMLVFFLAFMHLLERQMAHHWALTKGVCSLPTPEQHICDGSPFLACGLLLDSFGRRSDIASDEQIPNQIGDVDSQDSGLRARCPCLPQLGPENTMMSFEKAVEHGAFGLESDVHIR
ncbi:Glycerophosphodiester phosphodiesterase domain-containing protein 4, partial [Camelus dromedarius]